MGLPGGEVRGRNSHPPRGSSTLKLDRTDRRSGDPAYLHDLGSANGGGAVWEIAENRVVTSWAAGAGGASRSGLSSGGHGAIRDGAVPAGLALQAEAHNAHSTRLRDPAWALRL